MTALKISLNSIDKVKSFVNTIAQFDAEFDLVSGRYVIDAKSIMGIFSLDISQPIDLHIYAEYMLHALHVRNINPGFSSGIFYYC